MFAELVGRGLHTFTSTKNTRTLGQLLRRHYSPHYSGRTLRSAFWLIPNKTSKGEVGPPASLRSCCTARVLPSRLSRPSTGSPASHLLRNTTGNPLIRPADALLLNSFICRLSEQAPSGSSRLFFYGTSTYERITLAHCKLKSSGAPAYSETRTAHLCDSRERAISNSGRTRALDNRYRPVLASSVSGRPQPNSTIMHGRRPTFAWVL